MEERVLVADTLLRTLNKPDPNLDREWVAEGKRRLADLRSGRVKPVPGETVFAKIRERFVK